MCCRPTRVETEVANKMINRAMVGYNGVGKTNSASKVWLARVIGPLLNITCVERCSHKPAVCTNF